MDQSPLVDEQIEAANRFLGDFEKFAPIAVAFCLRESNESQWELYVAPSGFNNSTIKAAYAEVLRIAIELGDRSFDPYRVRVVGLGEATLQAACELYKGHSPKIPFRIRHQNLRGTDVEELVFLRGPSRGLTMSTGREMLNQIIDREASFFEQHGEPPRKIKLPVLMAYDLAKCGREELGELSGRVFKDGISVFEKEGFHGMAVEIVRDKNAVLQLE